MYLKTKQIVAELAAPTVSSCVISNSLKTVISPVFSNAVDSPEKLSFTFGVVTVREIKFYRDIRINFSTRTHCPRVEELARLGQQHV